MSRLDVAKELAAGTDGIEKEIIEMENKAYEEKIANDKKGRAHLAAGMAVGEEKMNALCKAAYDAGQDDNLAEYAVALLAVGFHVGYISALEGKR